MSSGNNGAGKLVHHVRTLSYEGFVKRLSKEACHDWTALHHNAEELHVSFAC